MFIPFRRKISFTGWFFQEVFQLLFLHSSMRILRSEIDVMVEISVIINQGGDFINAYSSTFWFVVLSISFIDEMIYQHLASLRPIFQHIVFVSLLCASGMMYMEHMSIQVNVSPRFLKKIYNYFLIFIHVSTKTVCRHIYKSIL